jgi:ATP-dependent RNA helicase RhlE
LCDTTPVSFASFDLDASLLEGIRDLGWVATRPIQSAVIRLALGGSDLIACAETGTGKTCAFVVPILQRLLTRQRDLKARPAADAGPSTAPRSHVLILAPTRELAVQIEDEIHGLAYHTAITSAAVYGGVEMGIQERALRAGVDIIVATPGRLIDHMRQQNADLGGMMDVAGDDAFAGLASGALVALGDAPLAQQVLGPAQIAFGLGERPFAVHHAGAGDIAQIFDLGGSNCGHV